MSGKTYEITDVIMAIENIGNELNKLNESIRTISDPLLLILDDIAGTLENLLEEEE